MSKPAVRDPSLVQFARYVAAPSALRPALAREIRAQAGGTYSPQRDFYLGLRRSLASGRRLDDDQRVLSAAVSNAHHKKQTIYRRLSRTWRGILDTEFAGGTWTEVHTARWSEAGLAVRVSPLLGLEYAGGRREAVHVYFPAAPQLDPAVVRAGLRVAELASPQVAPRSTPVLVDLQRGNVYRPSPVEPDYDAMLAAEAAGLSFLMTRLIA